MADTTTQALRAARAFLATDRAALVDAHTDPHTNALDAFGTAAVVGFDDLLGQIDAALAAPPFPIIAMGHGQYEVGAGKQDDLPCIAFGKNGSGVVGELITMEPRQMTVDETVLVITFANLMGLEVLQDKVNEVREVFFAGERAVLPDAEVAHVRV